MNSKEKEKDNEKNENKEEISEIKKENDYNNFLLKKNSKESNNILDIEVNASLENQDLNSLQKKFAIFGVFLQKIFFIIFFIGGFYLIYEPMIYFPINCFRNTSFVLLYLSLGNLSFMISFCFYHGNKNFLKIVVNKKNVGVVIGHLIGVIFGVMNLNKYYLIQIFLAILLCFITPSYIILFLPGKKQCNNIIDYICGLCGKIKECIRKNKDDENYSNVNTEPDE